MALVPGIVESPMHVFQMPRELYVVTTLLLCFIFAEDRNLSAQDRSLRENPELASWFEAEVGRLEQQNDLTRVQSSDDWQKQQPVLRGQLFDMLGLSPLPEKTPLQPEITGITEHPEFLVEKLHFQSLPGLYVTANFYRPRNAIEPLPTILYVCGHGQVKKDGVSFGNKTHYQHHGAWFARNGYNCLILDTLQLGEIEGIHHGTYRENRWWWNSRGYTPAGVEAWNCIRALDYLESRAEVDAKRFGVTGRSGGGAYSWWIAALDERIQCAVPVAGITSLRDHVVNGCVEGHCDCMYLVNTFRWDYATVAAMVAPRPLLISNTDKDPIFPLEGVIDVHRQVRHIYNLTGNGENLGLQITEGPHEDTQELHIHAFRWFNRFLKNDKSLIEKTAVRFFEPEQLKVFLDLPKNQTNTSIDDSFVPLAEQDPEDASASISERKVRLAAVLRERCFRAWPDADSEWKPPSHIDPENIGRDELSLPSEIVATRIRFESQPHVPLFLTVLQGTATESQPSEITLLLTASNEMPVLKSSIAPKSALVIFCPRGLGPHRWFGDEKKQIQIQRRFQLIGTTVDTMRVWDIRRALQVVRETYPGAAITLKSEDSSLSVLGLLASIFEHPAKRDLISPSTDIKTWPAVLNLSHSISTEQLKTLTTDQPRSEGN